jgi:hypothetical protein
VFDAGNRPELILPLRAEERAGKILAPRIFATGNAITYPGSHGDRISIGISDFEKDKALLDAHIAEQQPDMVKLMMDEEGWGSRPMITLLTADLAERSSATTTSTASARPHIPQMSSARWKRSTPAWTRWRMW